MKRFFKRFIAKLKHDDLHRRVVITQTVVGLFAAFVITIFVFSLNLPDYKTLEEYKPPVTTRFYANDGSLLQEYAQEKRVFIELDDIPQELINAFVATEDQNFWEHSGIDSLAILRAALFNIWNKITGNRRRPIGASTITQQVAKNFFLSPELSIIRKIREAILAVKMEADFSKEHILMLYFNQIYLGMRAYGIAAAAQNYFDKSVKELTLGEMAFLAGLPKAPNYYNPVTRYNEAIKRRNYVLNRMFEEGYITELELKEAKSEDIIVSEYFLNKQKKYAKYFTEEVKRKIVALYGSDSIYQGGLFVRTSADPDFQKYATDALRRGILQYDQNHGYRGPWGKINGLNDGSYEIVKEYSPEEEKNEEIAEEFVEDVEDIEDEKRITIYPTLEKVLKNIKSPDGALKSWKRAYINNITEESANISVLGRTDLKEGIIRLDDIKWARKNYKENQTLGPKITSVGQVLSKGDVIFVEEKGKGEYALKQIPDVDGGIVAIDPHTGRILALVGGFNFDKSQFNRVTQAARQPGSTIKPFIYTTALEKGYTPSSLILDAPVVMENIDNELWRPENYDKNWRGLVTLRYALENSINSPAIRTAQDLGIRNVINTAKRFGVYDDNVEEINLSMALGSGVTNLIKMTSAFATFVNGGKEITTTFIDQIQDRDGNTIYKRDERPCTGCLVTQWRGSLMPPKLKDNRPQIANERGVFQIVNILEGVVERGTGRGADVPGKSIAGKTGTSDDYKDAWFIGFSPDLAVGVYIGFDMPRTLGRGGTSGGSLAAPVFRDFMYKALSKYPNYSFRVPEGIEFVRTNLYTGLPASFDTPEDAVVMEAFKPGYEEKLKENRKEFANKNVNYKSKANEENYDDNDETNSNSTNPNMGGFY